MWCLDNEFVGFPYDVIINNDTLLDLDDLCLGCLKGVQQHPNVCSIATWYYL